MRFSFCFKIKTPNGSDKINVLKQEGLRANSLDDCISYLGNEYMNAKHPLLRFQTMDWMIYDFQEMSCYAGSFEINDEKGFIELISDKIDLSQFQK